MDVIGRQLVAFLQKSESEFYHDAILISQQGKRIGVHKVVLAAYSQHFNRMFLSPLQGNNNNNQTKVSVYHLPGTSSGMLDTILNWMYTGHIAVTGDNVLELMEQAEYFSIQGLKLKCEAWINDNIDSDNVVTVLDMATFLHLSHLIGQCQDFLLSGLNHQNAVEMWRMGEEHGMVRLKKKAWGWINQHLVLHKIGDYKGLLELSLGQLMELISSDCVASREEMVWEVVLRWASQPMKSRRELSEAVSAVRMDLIDPHFFQSEIRQSVLYKIAQHEDSKINESAIHKLDEEIADVDIRSGFPGGFLFSFINSAESNEVVVNAYNPRANTWTTLAVVLPGTWEGMKVAVLGSSIYLGGGIRKLGTLVEYRAFFRNIEIPVRRHQKSRKNTKSQNETVDSLPVEVFLDLLSNQSGALKGALPMENMLAQLLVLGLHGKDGRILDSVQHRTEDEPFGNTLQKILAEAVLARKFDTNLLTFTRLGDLPEGDMCVVGVEGRIVTLSYIWNYDKHTMAVYNAGSASWGRGPTSMTGGAGAGAAVVGGALYVVGNGCEVWDPDTDKWNDVPIDTQLQNEGEEIYCAALGGRLYVLAGGGAGWSFCPRTATWTKLPRVDNTRGWCMAVSLEGSLYGGLVRDNGETCLARLDGDSWDLVNCGGRSLSCCAVVNTRGLSRETRRHLMKEEE